MFTNQTEKGLYDNEADRPVIKVIILNGPPSSGKDTLTDLMVKFYNDKDMPCHHLRFKTKLYDLTQCVYSLTDNEMQYLKDNKEAHSFSLDGLTFRQALIKVSEYMVKPNFGHDYFGLSAAKALKPGINIFSDGGFKGELSPVIKAVGKANIMLVRLHRPGMTFDGDSRTFMYPEDLGVDSFDFHNIHTAEVSADKLLRELRNRG